jgi:serine/threonine protein kinase
VNVEVPPGVRPVLIEDPSVIGNYRVLGRLGVGGMGVVYLGFDVVAGRLVAIKTLHPVLSDDLASRLRFRAERDFGRRVSSFCIPRVLDDGMDAPHPYIVTDYVNGVPLAERVESQGPLAGQMLDAVAIAAAAALVAIHAAGLVHRDLKPSNVLLSPSGPKVIDFGIAADLEAAGGLTQTGVVMGSPGWIAPERLAGGFGSEASDVFGWGCLVAYAVTGHPPFGSGSAAERMESTLSGRPDLADLPEPWHALVMAALAPDPGDRPSSDDLLRVLLRKWGGTAGPLSAAETVADLWAAAGVAERAAPPPPPARPSSPTLRMKSQRNRHAIGAWAITAAAVTTALAVGIGGASHPGSPAVPSNGSTARPETSADTPAGPGRSWAEKPIPASSTTDRPAQIATSRRSSIQANPPVNPGPTQKAKKPKMAKAAKGHPGK